MAILRQNVVAAAILSPALGEEDNQQPAGRGMEWVSITCASSVPVIIWAVGKEEEKICAGDVGIRRCLDAVLWRLSIRCAFHKRERVPVADFFLPYSPPLRQTSLRD